LVRYAVERVGHQHVVHGLGYVISQCHGIGAQPLANHGALPGNLGLGQLEHFAIKIQGDHLTLDQIRERRREVAIATAQIEHGHAWLDVKRL
jgi:hypothetical protein